MGTFELPVGSRRMKVPASLLAVAVAVMAIAAISAGSETGREQEARIVEVPVARVDQGEPEVSEWFADELPVTMLDVGKLTVAEFPSREQLALIGRLSEGIYKWKKFHGEVPWYFCGERHNEEESKDLAVEVAFHIVRASWLAERKMGVPVNEWGVAGVAANESRFDRCAFGLYPRLASYEMEGGDGEPLLEKNRYAASHSEKQVKRAVESPELQAKFKAFDLGMIQVLDVYYFEDVCRHPKSDECRARRMELLTWPGFYWEVEHFANRSRLHQTTRPWMYWPGGRSTKYDNKVTRHARLMGASITEI
jgi:hypothetical protein